MTYTKGQKVLINGVLRGTFVRFEGGETVVLIKSPFGYPPEIETVVKSELVLPLEGES